MGEKIFSSETICIFSLVLIEYPQNGPNPDIRKE